MVGAASRKAPSKVPDRIYELFPVLKDMKNRRGGDLSGGQQQQLAIGRALMSEPQLLILDEPTEGIQPSIIQDIGRTLRQLVDEMGMTVLLVEQYYDFATRTRRPLLGDEPRRDRRGRRRHRHGSARRARTDRRLIVVYRARVEARAILAASSNGAARTCSRARVRSASPFRPIARPFACRFTKITPRSLMRKLRGTPPRIRHGAAASNSASSTERAHDAHASAA